MINKRPNSKRNVVAWFLLVSAIAVHVLDEALSDFLPFYNQLVIKLEEQLGFFPMPTFSFGVWLGGLIIGIAIGYALTPLVNRGGRFIQIFATILGMLMIANALGHLFGSIYFRNVLPGTWSSPLLLLAAFYVVFRGLRGEWLHKDYKISDNA